MKRNDARRLWGLIRAHAGSADASIAVQPVRPADVPGSFNGWFRDGRSVLGCAYLSPEKGPKVLASVTDWRNQDDYYVVLFEPDTYRPVLEVHETEERGSQSVLCWSYAPSRRDRRNPRRNALFARHYENCRIEFEIPTSANEVDDFLDELLRVVSVRRASDAVKPVRRPSAPDTFPEGKLFQRLHLGRERNKKLVAEAKRSALAEQGRLTCQVCRFDFEQTYGDCGKDFIEAHHTVPVSTLTDGSVTRIEDIALVCANCHRMLHRRRPWLTMENLRKLVSTGSAKRHSRRESTRD